MVKGRVNWVLDADIKSFFDTIDHAWMKKFIEHRIGDKRLVRLLMKWLKAGVMVEGIREETVRGTPQGGVISPLLANIYLHYVLDLWAHAWRKRAARQHVYIVRYADDFVMGFEDGRDARSMHSALRRRLREFGLELHEDKTRVLRFGRYARERCAARGEKPGTFDFLGFTHVCEVDRKYGWFQLHRHTKKKKRQATLRRLDDELKLRRHEPVQQTWKWLCRVLRGFDQYFGVPTNEAVLGADAPAHPAGLAPSATAKEPKGSMERAQDQTLREEVSVAQSRHRPPVARGTLCCPLIRCGSPVREIRTPGSVRGAARKGRPYRDP